MKLMDRIVYWVNRAICATGTCVVPDDAQLLDWFAGKKQPVCRICGKKAKW